MAGDMSMSLVVKHSDKIIFYGITKNASTSFRISMDGDVYHDNYSFWEKEGAENIKDYKKFTVLRNPINRVVSAFFEVIKRPINAKDKEFFTRFSDTKRFEGFIDEVEKEFFDVHTRPQTWFLTNRNTNKFIDMDYYLSFESLSEDFAKMNSELDLGFELIHLNQKDKKKELEILNYLKTNEHLLEKVKRIYKDDFNLIEKIEKNG